jgi:hypothetical protein
MFMERWLAFRVIDMSRKLMLLSVSWVGLSWMLLWMLLMYCSILSEFVAVES